MIQDKALVFDLGDVIIDLKPEVQWWQEDLLPNFEHEKLLQLFQQKFFHDFEKGNISVEIFLDEMNKIKTNPNIEIENAWNGILKKIPKHRIELLQSLSKENQIFLLSNTNQIHVNYIINDILATYSRNIFDDIFNIQFYSQEIGMRKPDKNIYEFVQERINIPPSSIYFFDDKNENLKIPNDMNWNTFLVNQDIANIIANLV